MDASSQGVKLPDAGRMALLTGRKDARNEYPLDILPLKAPDPRRKERSLDQDAA
jgi:hypothetical protein